LDISDTTSANLFQLSFSRRISALPSLEHELHNLTAEATPGRSGPDGTTSEPWGIPIQTAVLS
jgi:hypothetical protein